MKKSELKNLMERYLVFKSEIDDICNFISEIFELKAKELEANEPYATNTIKRYKDVAYEVFDLSNYIEEILEGEDE